MVPVISDWTDIFNQSSSQKENSSKVCCCATTFTASDFAYLKCRDSVQHLKAQAFSFDFTKLLATRFGWLCEKEKAAFIRVHKKSALYEFFPLAKSTSFSKQKLKVVQREYLGHHLNLKILTYPGQQRACIQKNEWSYNTKQKRDSDGKCALNTETIYGVRIQNTEGDRSRQKERLHR